ncbi:hypothetical protein NXW78_28220 [Bacteroides ovatus]|nr:hypothetical protein [Bacteroides ovatus]
MRLPLCGRPFQKRDVGIFKYMNFITIRETKLYVMMELVRMGSDSGKQDG